MAESVTGSTTNPSMDPSRSKDTEGSEGERTTEDKEAEAHTTNTDNNTPQTPPPPVSSPSAKTNTQQSQDDVSVSSSESGNSSSISSNRSVGGSSTNSSSTTTTTTTTTLGTTGMGNPFARAAPQTTWAESAEQRPILAPPRLGSTIDSGVKVSSSSSLGGGGGVLRPSALGSGVRLSGTMKAPSSFFPPPALTITGSSPPQQPTKTEFKLKPSVLSSSANPFAKSVSDPEDTATSTTATTTTPDCGSQNTDQAASATQSSPDKQKQQQQASPATSTSKDESATKSEEHNQAAATAVKSKAGNNSSSSSSCSSSNTSSNLFLPLGNDSDSASSPTLAKNSFIFGQNLHSKITATGGSGGGATVAGAAVAVGGGGGWGVSSSSADSSQATNGEKPTGNLFSDAASEVSRWSDGATAATINGQPHTGNLFSEAASGITQPQDESGWGVGQSLEESSREITEKEKSQKRKFDEVEVITGEENESNVLQMNCKLYAWVSGWWQERGRGILRLNDWDAGQEIRSRLVIRTQGTLTVMLNTKVWAEMSVERASSKSVRFTALDADGQPKIFLAMGSPKDVDLLYNSLEWRVATSRNQSQDDNASDTAKKPKSDDDSKAAPVPS